MSEDSTAQPKIKQWLVFNIGCLSCGISSGIVGIFDDEAEANRVATILDDKYNWRGGGENAYEVFELPPTGQINEEYREKLL
jgi:hypothetical protein